MEWRGVKWSGNEVDPRKWNFRYSEAKFNVSFLNLPIPKWLSVCLVV